ncbi:hypothetical protein G7Z17_g8096 [Cylindrodendrum hubeiense]|uniref:Phenazine biosynthesis protein n=1 Tax=Cylindrodendrum hubeiense TaxID=595255 RepID=A0A9P5L9B7_9HYPO|nr:hypothetical protein G7Z17_g8096 [Cylindrodendrum hubeiense]
MASKLDFVTLDVFTTTPYQGNPLGVVHLPPPTSTSPAITQAQKQAIAREFNYSETIFIHDVDPQNDTDPHTRRIDIFMTTRELPFAGHPTIGAAWYLKSHGITKLITKAGPIPIDFGPGELVGASIPHNTHLNSKVFADLNPHDGLHEVPEIKEAELRAPIFSIVPGMTFTLIRLSSLELLSRVAIGAFDYKPSELMDEGWSNTLIGRSYYVQTATSTSESPSTGQALRNVSIRTRMILPSLEDPATGSAACALTSYLSLHEFNETELRFELTQGVEMGRQSEIFVDVRVKVDEQGVRTIEDVHLSGTATKVMKGEVSVPPV